MSPTEGQPDATAGSLAEESARLLGAFREWAAKGQAAANDVAGQQDSASETGDTEHRSDCTYCPICQGVALLRGARPEVVEHLTEALSSLAAAVVALLPKDATPPERPRREPAQHIDVSGDDPVDSVG